MPILSYIFASLAAVVAGGFNALAGGGTLITFPTLLSIGLSPVVANITMREFPGYQPPYVMSGRLTAEATAGGGRSGPYPRTRICRRA